MTSEQTAQSDSKARNRWATAGMVLGIVTWTIGWFILFAVPPVQAAIVAVGIIASVIGLRRSKQVDGAGQPACGGRGFSIAGMVMNCLFAPIALVVLAFWIATLSNGGS